MSTATAITGTHQQDRAAQQKLVNARQHASAQGQQQGVAFAQLLSLACDEDTDLDALQLGGKLFGLPADEPADDADTPSTTRRKGGKGVATASGDTATDGAAPEGLHPTAQANATLLALLAQAQSAPAATADAAPMTTVDTAAVDVAPQGSTAPALATDAGAGATADTGLAPAPAAASTEAPLADATEKPVPGKAVRELARQLGAAMNNSSTAPDRATHGGDKGVAWGRQPADQAVTGLAQWPSGLVPASGHAPASGSQGPAALAADPRPAVADSDPAPTGDSADTTGTDQAAPVSSRSAGSASSDGQPPSGGLGGEALGGTEATDSPPSAEAAGSAADQWREQWAEAMDQMGQQVSYWVSQGGVRQATLRVGNGWQQAMDVKLSMKNGQAHIEFQTDHEAARSAIAEGGAEVLRDLLARSGIDLGQVSVGAQAGGGSGGQSASSERGMAAPGAERSPNQAGGTPTGTALHPRRSGSAGLDLYV